MSVKNGNELSMVMQTPIVSALLTLQRFVMLQALFETVADHLMCSVWP